MAGMDYYWCDICQERCFYDANVDWDNAKEYNLGELKALCKKCSETYEIAFKKRPKRDKSWKQKRHQQKKYVLQGET